MKGWLVLFAALSATAARADTLVLEASERGSISRPTPAMDRVFVSIGPEADYFAGHETEGRARSVFVFDLTSFEGTASAATLRIWSPLLGYRSPDRFESFEVHAVASDPLEMKRAIVDRDYWTPTWPTYWLTTWADLGEGAALGSGRIEPGPPGFAEIPLAPALLRVLERAEGPVALGLSITSLRRIEDRRFAGWEGVFGGTGGPDVPKPQLVLERTLDGVPAGASTLHVDAGSASDEGDGSPSAPFPTIAAALDLATPGDAVAVAPGRYPEGVIMKRGVDLLGAGADQTVVDTSEDLPSLRCADARLDGFFVMHEPLRAPRLSKHRVHIPDFLGAVHCPAGTRPRISNVAIAGGILAFEAAPIIERTRIKGWIGAGGAAFTLRDSSVDDQSALRLSHPEFSAEPVRIERNEFRGQVALYGFTEEALRVLDNLFLPWIDPRYGFESSGLRISGSPNAGLIAGNTFIGTRGIQVGVGSPCGTTRVTLANNLLAFGSAGIWGEKYYCYRVLQMLRNDVFGNFDRDGKDANYGEVIQDPTGTDGNLSLDPRLGPDFEPGADSPLLEAGANSFAEAEADLDGDARLADADGDGLAFVDIGAQERQPGPFVSVSIDVLPGKPNVLPASAARKRTVKVAIVSQPGFDAARDVAPGSLVLGGHPVLPGPAGTPACVPDRSGGLVCSFPGAALGGLAGLVTGRPACLTGETLGGVPIRGCDEIELRR